MFRLPTDNSYTTSGYQGNIEHSENKNIQSNLDRNIPCKAVFDAFYDVSNVAHSLTAVLNTPCHILAIFLLQYLIHHATFWLYF